MRKRPTELLLFEKENNFRLDVTVVRGITFEKNAYYEVNLRNVFLYKYDTNTENFICVPIKGIGTTLGKAFKDYCKVISGHSLKYLPLSGSRKESEIIICPKLIYNKLKF